MYRSVIYALLAAFLFGASTPFAKQLVGELTPLLLGGLLYLGSGAGLTVVRLLRDRGWQPSGLSRRQWPWLFGAIFFGGILAPVVLLYGLTRTGAATASLLLNFEVVLTAVLAWLVFKENAGWRIVSGMAAIVAGGIVLSWPSENGGFANWTGAAMIVAACLCWAIDNNLTRAVALEDALFVAASKGWAAGIVNCTLALMLGATWPGWTISSAAMFVGLWGYGLSLVLFVLALRGLGTARTGAYFATAPFIGALFSLILLGEAAPLSFWAAAALMASGVWLHLTESHEHIHTHEPLEHSHAHHHDEHHRHNHDFTWDSHEPHDHAHRHDEVIHRHPHFPDIHHRHEHD